MARKRCKGKKNGNNMAYFYSVTKMYIRNTAGKCARVNICFRGDKFIFPPARTSE